MARWVGAAKAAPAQRNRPPTRRREREERSGIAKETSIYRGCIGGGAAGFRAILPLLWSGKSCGVPFSLRENGHKFEVSLYTHGRIALAGSEDGRGDFGGGEGVGRGRGALLPSA